MSDVFAIARYEKMKEMQSNDFLSDDYIIETSKGLVTLRDLITFYEEYVDEV